MSQTSQTSPATTGEAAASSSFSPQSGYEFCLERASAARLAGERATAEHWIRQAQSFGLKIQNHDKLPGVTEAYARLANQICLDLRNLTLRSGNITSSHEKLVAELDRLCKDLAGHLKSVSDEHADTAAVICGLSGALMLFVCEHRQSSAFFTAAPDADRLLSDVLVIQQSLQRLGIKLSDPYGTSREILELVRTGISNARCGLVRLFSSRLSEWDKGELMCRWCERLLREHIKGERGRAAGSAPALDRLYGDLKAARAALSRHDYRGSSSSLEQAAASLEAFQATI